MNSLSTFVAYRHADAQPRSAFFEVWINGEKIDALHAGKADFAHFECDGPVDVLVRTLSPATGAVVRPLSAGIAADVDGGLIRFRLDGPRFLCVDLPSPKPLFLYANPPETDRPESGAPGVRFYAAGLVHEAGEITLGDGETLYIEAGAVVRGNVRASRASRVSIRGRGILDGGIHDHDRGARVRSVVFDCCERVSVRDIVMIEPSSWMLVLGACLDVRVAGLKQIGSCMSSDGIDICASRRVVVENCCLRNEDDNIAVKAGTFAGGASWEGDVDDVRVRRCVLLNGRPGNVMEIGYELRTDRVRNIRFEDIDVISAHGEGAVFSIHNGDRALVEDVAWEDIRVEHYWDKLVDLRVVRSRYNRDARRGAIRDIHFKNIRVTQSVFNPGCSLSVIGGFDADHAVDGVVFEDFHLNDRKVESADALELYTRHARGLRFL